MIYTIDMLNNCKISQYKIKKLLNFFVEDYTATETSNLTKLNRKTVNRYYNIFRKLIMQFVVGSINAEPESGEHIGYIKAEYGHLCYFNVYKINKKIFILTKRSEKPTKTQYATHDEDFNRFLKFLHNRFSNFYGFSEQGYYYQLFESMVKYNYKKEELYNIIWKQLKTLPKKMEELDSINPALALSN